MKTITLKKPLKFEGREIKVLNFDTDVATLAMDNEAYKKTFIELDGQMGIAETCTVFHRVWGMLIAAESNDIEYENLKRLSLQDLKVLEREGRNFLLGSDSSDESSQSTEKKDEIKIEKTEQEGQNELPM